MKIAKNQNFKENLISRIQTNHREREGLHMTDLLYPRKYYMRKKFPKPLEEREILYFLAGQGHEGALLKSLKISHGITFQWKGIWFSPDILEDQYVCEFKTRRKMLAKEGEESIVYEGYLKQLLGYIMAIREKAFQTKKFSKWKNIQSGKLAVLSLLEKSEFETENRGYFTLTGPKIEIYDVEYTIEEIENFKTELLKRKKMVATALKKNDIKVLPMCPPWMCGILQKKRETNAICTTCQKEYSSNNSLLSHIEKGHEVNPAIYTHSWIPRCKWFQECNPPIKEVQNGKKQNN